MQATNASRLGRVVVVLYQETQNKLHRELFKLGR